MPRICLSSKFPSRVNFRLDYTTQMTVHKATDELKNFLSPVASFFKEPSKSHSEATRARTDSVPPGHLCSKTASGSSVTSVPQDSIRVICALRQHPGHLCSKTASGSSVRQDSIRVICAPRQHPGHLCSKTASSVSRSMPSSIGPFLSRSSESCAVTEAAAWLSSLEDLAKFIQGNVSPQRSLSRDLRWLRL